MTQYDDFFWKFPTLGALHLLSFIEFITILDSFLQHEGYLNLLDLTPIHTKNKLLITSGS